MDEIGGLKSFSQLISLHSSNYSLLIAGCMSDDRCRGCEGKQNLFQVEHSGIVFSDFPVIEVKSALYTLNKQAKDMRYETSSI